MHCVLPADTEEVSACLDGPGPTSADLRTATRAPRTRCLS
jgi:hypothetical protein